MLADGRLLWNAAMCDDCLDLSGGKFKKSTVKHGGSVDARGTAVAAAGFSKASHRGTLGERNDFPKVLAQQQAHVSPPSAAPVSPSPPPPPQSCGGYDSTASPREGMSPSACATRRG